MYQSGAPESTANQDITSVSVGLIGCHCRTEMNGTTSPSSFTIGQLWTKLRLGSTVAADGMNPDAPAIFCWAGSQWASMVSIISSG